MRTLPYLALSLTLATLPAQTTYTFPSDHETVANGAGNTYFFPYSNGISRAQAVYDAWDVTVPVNTPITRIGFRQDGTNASTGQALQLQVLMGYTTSTAVTIGSTFATNVAGAQTTVFGPALYTLPSFGTGGGGTAWLDLTTPFAYNPPAGQNLLIEWRVLANNNGNASFTYYLDRANFLSPIVNGPAGCPHSGSNTALLTSQGASVAGFWNLSLSSGPANSPLFLAQNPGQLLSAPYSLGNLVPGINPSCTGQVSLTNLFLEFGSTNGSGGFSRQIPVPNIRSLNDLQVASQCVMLDFFSPGGVVVSNGVQMQLGIEPAMTIVYASGSATATTGSVSRNYGVVTLFQ